MATNSIVTRKKKKKLSFPFNILAYQLYHENKDLRGI